jgi:hypothetical protein
MSKAKFDQRGQQVSGDQYNAGRDININRPVEYEYKEVAIPWKHSTPHSPAVISIRDAFGEGMSLEDAQEVCWQAERWTILRELVEWFDEGWEPAGQAGPEGVEFEITRVDRSKLGTWVDLPPPWGLTVSCIQAEPKSYRVLLRRPKL